MRAQKTPCPCDFESCLELAEEGGAVEAYVTMYMWREMALGPRTPIHPHGETIVESVGGSGSQAGQAGLVGTAR